MYSGSTSSSPLIEAQDFIDRAKLVSTNLSADITVTLQTVNPLDSLTGAPLPFLHATQKCGDGKSMPVYARIYPKGKTMKPLYDSLLDCKHKNILKVLSLTHVDGMDVIAFEPVAGTLFDYIERTDIFTARDILRITEFLPDMQFKIRGIITGIGKLRSQNIRHGKLSAKDIFVTHDGDIKLGLGDHSIFSADEKGTADEKYVADLIMEIFRQKKIRPSDSPKEFLEILDLVNTLRTWHGKTDLLIHSALCTPNHKWLFMSSFYRKLGTDPTYALTVRGWRENLKDGIASLPKGCRKQFKETFADFFKVVRNVPEHLHNRNSAKVRNYFGTDQDLAMRRIQMCDPLLFVKLMGIANKHGKLSNLILNTYDGWGSNASAVMSCNASKVTLGDATKSEDVTDHQLVPASSDPSADASSDSSADDSDHDLSDSSADDSDHDSSPASFSLGKCPPACVLM